MTAATGKLKKNVEGFRDHLGIFHPIRSGSKEQGRLYDGQAAGDNDDIFDKMIRRDKNEQKAQEIYEKRLMDDALNSALGENKKLSLSQYVRKAGGLRYDPRSDSQFGELATFSHKESGRKGIAHRNGKHGIDGMRESADEAGYKWQGAPMMTESDFLDALAADLKGNLIYPFGGISEYEYKSNPKKADKSQFEFWTEKAKDFARSIRLLRKNKKIAKANKLEKAQKLALDFARRAKKTETTMKTNPVKTAQNLDRYFVAADPTNKKLFCVKRQKAGASLSQFVSRNLTQKEANEAVQHFNRETAKLKKVVSPVKTNSVKTKKTMPAKKAAKPRKNGLLSGLATAAVGTSAALNVYDRLNKNTKTPTGAAKNLPLRHNAAGDDFQTFKVGDVVKFIWKDSTAKYKVSKFETDSSANYVDLKLLSGIKDVRVPSQNPKTLKGVAVYCLEKTLKHNKAADVPYHEREFEKLLVAIEKGDYSKIRSAKMHGKLANWSDREVEHFISQAKFAAQLKLNPTTQIIKKVENLFLKQNGIFGRALARHKAGSLYKRELKLQAALSRAKEKRAKQETKAKKNPTRKNPFDAYESFQGRPSTKTVEIVTPKGAPKNIYCLGKLLELRLKGAENMNFRRENSGKTFYICADNANKQLWIAGGTVAKPDKSIKDGFSEPLAKITHIVYETQKVHLDDKGQQGYIHEFGEEGGEQPTLAIDNAGFPIIVGGDYSITPLGIAD